MKHIYTCYRCGKTIRGQVMRHIPPLYLIRLGIDFPKAYHEKCYLKTEAEAEQELRGKTTITN